MAQNAREWLNAPIINLDTTDSTNNDAMLLIDADKAQTGTTIVAAYQRAGRGQRGNGWVAKPGESLMMSMITVPRFGIEHQFAFSAVVACAVQEAIQSLDEQIVAKIKWPNDLMVNDKKAGGILIENVLRGHAWLYAVIGLGLNVLQDTFDPELPHATSLRESTGRRYDVAEIMNLVREKVALKMVGMEDVDAILAAYNEALFRKEDVQVFTKDGVEWAAIVKKALPNGQLEVQLANGQMARYTHGDVRWKY